MATDREKTYGKSYNDAGYIEINPGSYQWFNENLGTNFGSAEDYYKWIYGGGNLVSGADLLGQGYDVAQNAMYLQTPNGISNYANAPLDYNPQGMEFADYVLAGMGAVAGAGLGGYLPGTENVFANFSLPSFGGDNILSGMDLSSGLANLDDFSYGTLTSGAEGAGFNGAGATGAFGGYSMPPPMTPPGAPMDPNWATPLAGASGGTTQLPGALGGLQNILTGNGGLTDWLQVGGAVGPSILGYFGADKQADMNRDMFNQYFGAGAPFRSLLQQSYQPGFDISKEPGFQNAMDTALNTYMRAASAGRASGVSKGNPYDNPGAMMESQKYLLGNLALPYLQNYRSGLTNAGQLGFSQSVPFGAGQIQAEGGKYDAIGYGLGELFGNKPDYGIQLGTTPPFNPDPRNSPWRLI